MTYRKFTCLENVEVCLGPSGNQKRSKLTTGHQHQRQQDEGSEPMAYDPQMLPDSKVLGQDGPHIGVNVEDRGKVFKPQDLEVADQTEENANEENDGRPIEPRAELHDTCYDVARHNIA